MHFGSSPINVSSSESGRSNKAFIVGLPTTSTSTLQPLKLTGVSNTNAILAKKRTKAENLAALKLGTHSIKQELDTFQEHPGGFPEDLDQSAERSSIQGANGRHTSQVRAFPESIPMLSDPHRFILACCESHSLRRPGPHQTH